MYRECAGVHPCLVSPALARRRIPDTTERDYRKWPTVAAGPEKGPLRPAANLPKTRLFGNDGGRSLRGLFFYRPLLSERFGKPSEIAGASAFTVGSELIIDGVLSLWQIVEHLQAEEELAVKAARIHSFGPPDVVVVEEVPVPSPGPTEVLVRVMVAGVAPWDAIIREGKSKVSPQPPLTLGSDFSGVVGKVGPGVTGFAPAD